MAKKPMGKVPQPYQDRLIITKMNPETKSAGGIIIPESAIVEENKGIVVAVGPTVGEKTLISREDGSKQIPKVGDTVIFGEYAGIGITFEGKEYIIVKEADVLAGV